MVFGCASPGVVSVALMPSLCGFASLWRSGIRRVVELVALRLLRVNASESGRSKESRRVRVCGDVTLVESINGRVAVT